MMNWMKGAALGASLAVAVSLMSLLAAQNKNKPYKVGDKVADFTLKDLNGKPVKLSQYKGKVIVLTFFALW